MQASAMKACFQIAECSLSYAKIVILSEIANVYVCFFMEKHHFFNKNL